MTQNFIDTLFLYSCAIRGFVPNADKAYDFRSIYTVAQSQGIWDTVFLSVKTLRKNNQIQIDNETYQDTNKQFVVQYGKQEIRYSLFHRLVHEFNESGIKCCILKGESVAQYYPNPNLRVSSDIDILIEKDDLDKCIYLLKENGFSEKKTKGRLHHVSFVHPTIGLLEIHTKMYSDLDNDIAMENMITYE